MGEDAVGVSFIFGFDMWRHQKYPVQTIAPCEGASYEIGGIALVKGPATPPTPSATTTGS